MSDHKTEIIRGTLLLVIIGAGIIWFVVRSVRKAEDPNQIIFKWILSIPLLGAIAIAVPVLGPFGPFLIIVCAVILSVLWTPHIGAAVVKPFTSLFDGGDLPPELKPLYSIARARQKQGKYLEAVAEVRKQLDRFPTDLEGLMLLAEIQAQNLKDLDAAETTIQRLCNQPGHSPRNIAFALYSMADWHLEIGKNREGAQACLEKLIALFPNTEFALGAAQRIAHLGSSEMLSERHNQRIIPFPPGQSPQIKREGGAKTSETDDSTLAVQYVEQLRAHPHDTDAREKLAGLYAEHYGRLDLATAELEELIQHPKHPSRSVVRWLNLLADYQVKCGASLETVRGTLQRIIDRDPDAAAAGLARNRLALLKLELKANEKSQGVKLGSYEQNIGLKRGLPNQL